MSADIIIHLSIHVIFVWITLQKWKVRLCKQIELARSKGGESSIFHYQTIEWNFGSLAYWGPAFEKFSSSQWSQAQYQLLQWWIRASKSEKKQQTHTAETQHQRWCIDRHKSRGRCRNYMCWSQCNGVTMIYECLVFRYVSRVVAGGPLACVNDAYPWHRTKNVFAFRNHSINWKLIQNSVMPEIVDWYWNIFAS